MADINRVTLVGRLTRDAELKSISSGQSVCKFSVAVNRRRKNGDQYEDEVNYFDVVLWGRQGETLHNYLRKGKLVGIDGELKQDRWLQDGQNRSKIEIVASYVQLLGAKSDSSEANSGGSQGNHGNSGYGTGGSSTPQQGYNSQQQGGSGSSNDDFADDIPF